MAPLPYCNACYGYHRLCSIRYCPMLPHSIQKVSLSTIGASLLMLLLLLLERLGIFHLFGSSTANLISIFSILIYIAIFFSIISSEKEENTDIKSLRTKVASAVSFAYFIVLLCFKMVNSNWKCNDFRGQSYTIF